MTARWDYFDMNLTNLILALIAIESGGAPDAVRDDCVGVLQLRPCYVHDVNRIIGRQEFTLADRRSRVKSIRMARVMFAHYSKASWGVREFALFHRKGIRGMHGTITQDDEDYAKRVENLMRESNE